MDRFSDIGTEELEKKVKARQLQIEKIGNFVEEITREMGKTTQVDQGSSYTHVVRRLDNFGYFSFLFSTGHNMYGGRDFKVWYRPEAKFNQEIDTEKVKPVLSVYYQLDIDECKVNVFDESLFWQDALEYLMNHKDDFVAQREKAKRDQRKQLNLQAEKDVKRSRVLVDAERLSL